MTETIRREPGASLLSVIWSARHDPAARIFNIDLLTVLIAILLRGAIAHRRPRISP